MDMDYEDPLYEAVIQNNETFVLELLEFDDPAIYKEDALLAAVCTAGRENIINLLLQYGARSSHLILDRAVERYDEKIVEKLLQHGPDVKDFDFFTSYPLHIASSECREASSKICEVLIKYGAEVNQENSPKTRSTPLGIAVNRNNDEVIEVLLQYGAQPCREMNTGVPDFGVPLEFCFSLKGSTIESMIKYAALQVDSVDEEEVQKFFQYIANSHDSEGIPAPDMGKKYIKYAKDCMGEVQSLREKFLNEDRVSLFDFVISQRDVLETYRRNETIINSVLDHLTSAPFPIFCEVIVKKLERNMIIRKLVESPCPKKCYILERRKIFLNTDCIERIASYLPVIDLGNFLIALNTIF